MKKIVLPFTVEMRQKAIAGTKIATTRSEQKGNIGDYFALVDYDGTPFEFRIIDVMPVDLEVVANAYFVLEGFASPAEFRAAWREMHKGTYNTKKTYYIHFFSRMVRQ